MAKYRVMAPLFPAWSDITPVIGMVHLLPLPGSPRYGGDLEVVGRAALQDAEALVQGGVHGLMMENYGDLPFLPGPATADVLAAMTAMAIRLRSRFQVPLGINVLRNDGLGALAVALASGADFIRVNVLVGARLTDQGIITGQAHEVMRRRAILNAGHIKVLADVAVKHSAPLAEVPLADEVADTIHRGGADGVIITGSGTGRPADQDRLKVARMAAADASVLVGSGVTPESVADFLPLADGFIIGTSLKQGGVTDNPVDPARVKKLMARLCRQRSS